MLWFWEFRSVADGNVHYDTHEIDEIRKLPGSSCSLRTQLPKISNDAMPRVPKK